MKNITISLEEEVAHWARVWAAENDTSVSRFVGDLLQTRMEEERGYRRASRSSAVARGGGEGGAGSTLS